MTDLTEEKITDNTKQECTQSGPKLIVKRLQTLNWKGFERLQFQHGHSVLILAVVSFTVPNHGTNLVESSLLISICCNEEIAP